MRNHSNANAHRGPVTSGHVIHWAPVYEAVFGRFLRRTHDTVVELAALQSGERVLDVACGTGSLTLALKASVGPTGSVHGIDASPQMIELAHRNQREAAADVDFRTGVAEELPFADATFDVVVSQLAIHHLPDDLKQSAFAEMYRVLRPSGRCLIVDFEPPKSAVGRLIGRLVPGPVMMRTNVTDYVVLMEKAGFREVETGKTGYALLSFVRGRAEK